MKNKDLIIEILIALLVVITISCNFYVNSLDYIHTSFSSGFVLGVSIGYYFTYLQIKKQLQYEEKPNLEQAIKIWRNIIVGIHLLMAIITLLFYFQVIQSEKIWLAYFFLVIMIWGNYKPRIEPIGYIMDAFLVDEDVAIKTKRVSAKVTFFCGLVGVLCTPFMTEKYALITFFSYVVLVGTIPYFYAKYLHKQKYA